jgi:hypothetical protein
LKTLKPLGAAAAFLMCTVVFTLAAIGAVALAVDDAKFRPSSSADLATWVQAAAAAFAILASAGIAIFIQTRDHRVAKRQSADVAVEIALYARNVLQSVRDSLATRQQVYDVAVETVYFDKSVMDDLWNMLSSVPLQELRDVVITRELIVLRGTVRQFRENVETALRHFRELNAHEYDTFFRVLNDAATAASKVHANISARANTI